jgi:beta-lactam-binding protein with PASTA domain
MGFKVAFEEKETDDFTSGSVIEQTPKAGKDISRQSAVKLVVDIPIPIVPVPSVKGRTLADAQRELRRVGLRWTITTQVNDNLNANTVIEQNPQSTVEIKKGRAVQLTVSAKTVVPVTPPAVPPTVPATVPPTTAGFTLGRYYGLTESAARERLQALKLMVVIQGQTVARAGGRGQAPQMVISQDPKEGTTVHAGDKVTLQMGPMQVVVP